MLTNPTTNEAGIANWLRLFFEPGQVTELRALNVKRRYGKPATVSGFYDYDHFDLMARDALKLTNRGLDGHPAPGVYFVINPVNPDLIARRANRMEFVELGTTTADSDIVRRRWMLIDIDPVRPSGMSATDEEKGQAEDVALRACQHLKERGWPQPIIVDSGNGWHLYYRVDLPPDDNGLIKDVLHGLAAKCDTDRAHVDTLVFNPARISKLPFTKSRKGDDIAGRPHRWSRIFHAPVAINCHD